MSEHREIINVIEKVYSATVSIAIAKSNVGFEGQRDRVYKCDSVKTFGNRYIEVFLLDRGGNQNTLYDHLINEQFPLRFIMRWHEDRILSSPVLEDPL